MSCVAIVAAAGIGSRMHSEVPKQYLPFSSSHTILEKTCQVFLSSSTIQQVYVTLHPEDQWFHQLELAKHPKVTSVIGGQERAHSVHHALQRACEQHRQSTYVAVHDAARPGVQEQDIQRLLQAAKAHSDSCAIAAVPAWDTMKWIDKEEVKTLNRSCLWHAYTPQVFELHTLYRAYTQALKEQREITDEASAIEHIGLSPAVVEVTQRLRKITTPEDLIMVQALLKLKNEEDKINK